MNLHKYFIFILLWSSLNSNTADFGWSCLYQPNRAAYDKKVFFDKECDTKQEKECVFCRDVNVYDDANTFIIKRFKHNFVALNLFPYQKGHLLVLPFDHVDSLDKMTTEARAELMEIITLSVNTLIDVFNADGANVGINLGRATRSPACANSTTLAQRHELDSYHWQNITSCTRSTSHL